MTFPAASLIADYNIKIYYILLHWIVLLLSILILLEIIS